MARWVGVELIGIYSISNAVTRIFEVIAKMGLDQGVLRAINRNNNQLDKMKIILSALKMGLISSLFFMCIQILIADWLINLAPLFATITGSKTILEILSFFNAFTTDLITLDE